MPHDYTNPPSFPPYRVELPGRARSIAMDTDLPSYGCVLLEDGRVMCVGSNRSGDELCVNHPWCMFVDVALPGRAKEIAVLGGAACALLEDRRLVCWGRAFGHEESHCDPPSPTYVASGFRATRARGGNVRYLLLVIATHDERARLIACSRLFRGLDPKLVSMLAAHASVLQLAHGDALWREGQPAEHFNVVTRGVLELQRSSGSDTTLVALFGPGESPGVPVALERARYIATSYAITPTVDLLRVSAHAVLAALPHEPSLALALNRGLLEHCRLLHAKIDVLTTGTVPRRLAALMLDLAERFGDEMADGSTFIPLPLTRGQIATYIGVRVETVIRCCTGWARTGILSTTADGFSIPELAIMEDIARGDIRPLRCRSACDCAGPCEIRTAAIRAPAPGRLD